jgi:hypothetical protein
MMQILLTEPLSLSLLTSHLWSSPLWGARRGQWKSPTLITFSPSLYLLSYFPSIFPANCREIRRRISIFMARAGYPAILRASAAFSCARSLVIRLYIIFHSHRFSLARKVNFARTPVTKRYALNGARRRLCAHSDKMKHAKRQFCARQTNYSADCKLNGHIKAGLQV